MAKKTKRIAETLKAEMMSIVEAWKQHGGQWPAPKWVIVDFAIKNGLYRASSRVRQMCAKDLADALREEHFKDDEGRPVRRYASASVSEIDDDGNKVQRDLWGDVDELSRDFKELAFHQRRDQIVGDCRQLDNDVSYCNKKHPDEPPIRMLWDMTDDVEEGRHRGGDEHKRPQKG